MEFTMKKILLAAALGAAFAATAQAKSQDNPLGEMKAVEASSTATVANAMGSESALPAAMVTDASMDLEKTMKMMGKNFKALSKADDLLTMHKEAEELAVYASQGEAIGLDPKKASDEAKAEYARLMQKLRGHIAELQQAIEQKDADKAKAALEATNEVRKEGHKYFDV